jgi:hypothetical protein
MSYFALVKNNIVQQIISAEQDYIDSLPDKYDWIQTSYNTRGGIHYDPNTGLPDGGIALRANYALINGVYDAVNDVFYARKPFNSWVLNKNTWLWEAPVAYPTDGKNYTWDETIKTWAVL